MENKQNVNIIFSDIINLKILPLIDTQLFDLLFQFIALEWNHEAHSDSQKRLLTQCTLYIITGWTKYFLFDFNEPAFLNKYGFWTNNKAHTSLPLVWLITF